MSGAATIRERTPAPPGAWSPSERFLDRVPLEFAREHLVLGVGDAPDGAELLLIPDTGVRPEVVHNVGARLGVAIATQQADAEALAERIDALLEARSEVPQGEAEVSEEEVRIAGATPDRDKELLASSGRSAIVQLLASLLLEGVRMRASDMHIQPSAAGAVVRFRVDGLLASSRELAETQACALIARVKVLAGMDVTERRVPQDGRTAVTVGGKEIDLRISTLPTARGERLVVRLLDKRSLEFFDLSRLGMPTDTQRRFAACCATPSGMVLVCGPTGSGKSTTLYSVLRRLSRPGVNVMTLEDPVEYELEGISQSQTNSRKGVNFSTGLRYILRQDPDIVMVGEIRDTETASTAVQAALTGHIVLSTLHTNSAAGAVTRLTDLGVEPYLLNATLTGVLSQRLLRRLCQACDESGAVCHTCHGRRYSGRVGVYELLELSKQIEELVRDGASTSRLHQQAVSEGMVSIADNAESLVRSGVTSREEVLRVLGAAASGGA